MIKQTKGRRKKKKKNQVKIFFIKKKFNLTQYKFLCILAVDPQEYTQR